MSWQQPKTNRVLILYGLPLLAYWRVRDLSKPDPFVSRHSVFTYRDSVDRVLLNKSRFFATPPMNHAMWDEPATFVDRDGQEHPPIWRKHTQRVTPVPKRPKVYKVGDTVSVVYSTGDIHSSGVYTATFDASGQPQIYSR